jgi:membrane-bound inhibitor of C-type lysozyme
MTSLTRVSGLPDIPAFRRRVLAGVLICGALVGAGGGAEMAQAAQLVLPLPDDVLPDRVSTSYVCKGIGPMTVDYINAGEISLALVPVTGDPLVFANVLSASGARYAAGPYVWWTSGRSAALYDLRNGPDAPPVPCEEK